MGVAGCGFQAVRPECVNILLAVVVLACCRQLGLLAVAMAAVLAFNCMLRVLFAVAVLVLSNLRGKILSAGCMFIGHGPKGLQAQQQNKAAM